MVSACLLGAACAYDGEGREDEVLRATLVGRWVVPVCPEQLGGLPTPRSPAEITGGSGRDVLCGRARVRTRCGRDVTREFRRGADETARLARLLGCRVAVFKPRSPSCGPRGHYDGSFTAGLIEGTGVAAEALRRQGVAVISPTEYTETVKHRA